MKISLAEEQKMNLEERHKLKRDGRIERLWKVMNEQIRNNIVFKTFRELKGKTHAVFDET